MDNRMYLVGSRLLGINSDSSDWDYVLYDEQQDCDFKNVHFEIKKHCYHYKRAYREAAMRFEIDNPLDHEFLYNAIDYKSGFLSESPFEYRDKWIAKMKGIDFSSRYFKDQKYGKWMKRFYHVVYNLECLKQNTVDIDADGLSRVKRFHDLEAKEEEYQIVISEIENLST